MSAEVVTTVEKAFVPQPADWRPEPDKIEDLPALVTFNAKMCGGEPCIGGARLPVQILFDYLSSDDAIAEFLEQYPSVSRETVRAIIDTASRLVKATAVYHAGQRE